MNPNTTTRRTFFGAVAAATAGVILLPTPAAPATTGTEADRQVLSRVRAILTTPPPSRVTCHCAACMAVKARPFRCVRCGYHGPPATFGCACDRSARDQLAFYQNTLRVYPTAANWPSDWRTSRSAFRRSARLLGKVLATSGPLMCVEHGKGHPAALTAVYSAEGNCCHTAPFCALCDSCGEGDAADAHYLEEVMRELQAALVS